MKNGFSPWRTKQYSIEIGQEDQIYNSYAEQKKIMLENNTKINSKIAMAKIAQRRPNSNNIKIS